MTAKRVEPRIFKGTRDFLPERMRVRQRVVEALRSVFESFGFEPIETPAVEFHDILTGKSGEEADHLLFRLAYQDGRTLALRYDLTVPLSRVVAMYGKSMLFPFKRYQIQPVWRAEKPQKGRYREFLQCDVDTVGSASMAADAEILLLACDAMETLGFADFTVALNNRKIMNGVYRALGVPEALHVFTSRAVDKIEKAGPAEVRRTLLQGREGVSVPAAAADALLDLIASADLAEVEKTAGEDEEGRAGVEEVREILRIVSAHPQASKAVRYTPSMVRGLDYYTGPIFEMIIQEPRIGSLGGGGRYDGLVGLFSGDDLPATGFSFGLERLIDALEASGKGAAEAGRPSDVLVTVFSRDLQKDSVEVAGELRKAGLRTEVYLDAGRKLKKQFDYANRRNLPVVIVLGPDEIEAGRLSVKWMERGAQETMPRAGAAKRILEGLGRL